MIPQYQMLFGMDKVELKFTQVRLKEKKVTHDKIDLFRKLWQRFQGWQSTEKRELVD